MEALLQYCWKHRIFPSPTFTAADGREIEVIDPGLQNFDAGPDFFNAKIRIAGETWAGNVEIHTRREEWYAHGHDRDAAYDNVILHVVRSNPPASRSHACREEMAEYGSLQPDFIYANEGRLQEYAASQSKVGVKTSAGRIVPEISMPVPQYIEDNYAALSATDAYPPCYRIIPELSPVVVTSWMAALQTERLMRKTEDITKTLNLLNGDWEHTYFTALARSMGFGSNSDNLEIWARNMPLNYASHHRDNLFQVEALFFGQAGLLNVAAVHERMKLETAADPYFQRLSNEYAYLSHKFGLQQQRPPQWKFMRMRPQNFPHIRIAQLARLFHERRASLSQLLGCTDVRQLKMLLGCGVSDYWETHYTFGHESRRSSKQLSASSVNSIAINCAIPILFAYGRHNADENLCQRAVDLLEDLPAEQNNIIRLWQEVGMKLHSAADTQALIQLKNRYCDRRDCLRCRFGHEHLRRNTRKPL